MTKVFDATSTTDDVLSGVSLEGKRILVTGVSAGIGVETARALAARGAQVVGAARDLSKAEAATAHVIQITQKHSGKRAKRWWESIFSSRMRHRNALSTPGRMPALP